MAVLWQKLTLSFKGFYIQRKLFTFIYLGFMYVNFSKHK